jgi:Asp-tRNA(Asn)/Glu-tRNA(Gln) amidotransferase C subunit
LQNVEVDDLPPTYQVTGLTNVTREDQLIDYGYKPANLLKNVPAVVDNQIKVKRIL